MSDGLSIAVTEALEAQGVGLKQAMAIYAIVERRYGDARDWLDAMNGAAAAKAVVSQELTTLATDKKSLQVGKPKKKGVRHGNGGHKRVCTVCNVEKGITVFKAGGGTVCSLCRRAREGKVLDPGLKIVRCSRCGKGFPSGQVNGDGYCAGCA